jgi:hypothetical protein
MIPQRMPGRENSGGAVGYRVSACRRRLRIIHAINRAQARMHEDVRKITLSPAGIDGGSESSVTLLLNPSLSARLRVSGLRVSEESAFPRARPAEAGETEIT